MKEVLDGKRHYSIQAMLVQLQAENNEVQKAKNVLKDIYGREEKVPSLEKN